MGRAARMVFFVFAGWSAVAAVPGVEARAAGTLPQAWVGKWAAPQYKVPLSSDLDLAVWGRNAFSVRDVDLSVEPDGDAVLKVFNSVVDQRGRTKQFSASVTEARLQIRAEDDPVAGTRAVVTVRSSETRYLDGSGERTPVTGLVVTLSPVPGRAGAMNFRFDTARGEGSFGETLTRQTASRRR